MTDLPLFSRTVLPFEDIVVDVDLQDVVVDGPGQDPGPLCSVLPLAETSTRFAKRFVICSDAQERTQGDQKTIYSR